MFDFDAGKLLIVGVIALMFIPPKDLPRVLRQVGQFVGRMRRMATEFQGQFMDAMREADMTDLRKEAQKLADAARIETRFPSAHDIERDMSGAIEAKSDATKPESDTSEPHALAAGTSETHNEPATAELPKPAQDADAFEALQTELRPLVSDKHDEPHAISVEPTADHVPHSA